MQLLSIITILGLSRAIVALPSALDARQTPWTGTCDVASNTCIISNPPELAGYQMNCGAAAGFRGGGLRNSSCAEQGHVSHVFH